MLLCYFLVFMGIMVSKESLKPGDGVFIEPRDELDSYRRGPRRVAPAVHEVHKGTNVYIES